MKIRLSFLSLLSVLFFIACQKDVKQSATSLTQGNKPVAQTVCDPNAYIVTL